MSSTEQDESAEEPEVASLQLREKPGRITCDDALPEKSRIQYNQCYTQFMEWLKEREDTSVSEHNLLAYFEMMKNQWKPSTAWSKYSMLKSTIFTKLRFDISEYRQLNKFLTKNSKGFTSQKSKVLEPEHVQRFLTEAPDNRYLAVKVALIFGITGACRRDELKKITIQDIEHHNNMVLVRIRQHGTNTPRKFTVDGDFYEIFKRYEALRPTNAWSNQFFLCVRDGKCTQQVIGINTFGAMPKLIAEYLGLSEPEKYTGHSFRRTSASMLADGGADLQTLKRHRRLDRSTRGYDDDSIVHKKKICTEIGSSAAPAIQPTPIKLEFVENTPEITIEDSVTFVDVDVATQTDFPASAESRERTPEMLFCWQDSNLREASTQATIATSPPLKEETSAAFDAAAAAPNNRTNAGFSGFGDVKNEQTMNRMAGVSRSFFAKLLLFVPFGSAKSVKKLCRENRLLLFLMKMKLGLSFDDLGGFFGVNGVAALTIFLEVLEVLYSKTRAWISWPSREAMPVTFSNYPDCRAIIDVTEVRCEEPPHVDQRIIMHSRGKGCFTTKYLLAIGPNGLVAFVSRGYGGRTSDETVAMDSGFVELVEPGDEIMADQDFPLVRAELEKRRCSLVTQPLARDPLMSDNDDDDDDAFSEDCLMAFVREHVDEAIERIKEFRILELINVRLFPYIDEIIFLTCVLANNMPNISQD